MPPLAPELRHDLDKAIVAARGLAEAGARAALDRLGAEGAEAPAGLSRELRELRTALRERAKALGGGARSVGVPLLVEEIAYEQWHRMLFARFLAENDLLLHPEGAPVSLAEVRELAAEEDERDPWVLAARYAAAMLPGIFRADDPANQVQFAPEDRSRLEAVLERLPAALFTADDALGWVYQFWQSERKDEVNKRGDKIGGADLPSVTQLFTEHYMVRFLLENSLGAWWAGRHPDSPLLREWDYLRFRDDGSPAAGTFEDWPARAAEVTVMDPCCGSGHFLVAAADMLRKMRIEEDGLTPAQAASAVIRDNLFGLELDGRCLQLAAFNLALDAWKAGRYQPLPVPNLACTGIAIKGQRADWHRLADGDPNMADALDRLYDLFQDAPQLGSLIDPRAAAGDGLWAVDPDKLLAKLDRVLQREASTDPAAAVFGAAAAGTAKAARLLASRYWLVATNPPFLGRGQQNEGLRRFLDLRFAHSKADLATALLSRTATLAPLGTLAFVLPQNWWSLGGYQALRIDMLHARTWAIVARLGAHAFTTIGGEVVNVTLQVLNAAVPTATTRITGVDASGLPSPAQKAAALAQGPLITSDQARQLDNPDSRVVLGGTPGGSWLSSVANSRWGLRTADNARFVRKLWELDRRNSRWSHFQGSVSTSVIRGGREDLVLWEAGGGTLARFAELGLASIQGADAWGKQGIAVGLAGNLPATLYDGDLFANSVAALWPFNPSHLAAVWCFVTDPTFATQVRRLDSKLIVTNQTLLKVPFDLEHWTRSPPRNTPTACPNRTATTRRSGCSRAPSLDPRRHSRSPSLASWAIDGPTRSPMPSTNSPMATASSHLFR